MPKFGFGLHAANNGKIYVFGGLGSPTTAFEFDPDTDSWTTLAPMPTGRFALAVALANGELYAVGGCCAGDGSMLSIIETYDPATDSWGSQTPLPSPRANFGLVSGDNKMLFAIGGWGPGGNPGYGGNGALATVEAAALDPTQVGIDILPGQYPNAIRPGSLGNVSVAIHTTSTFDATQVDPNTVRFGPDLTAPGQGTILIKDTDHDGDLDLYLQFRIRKTGIRCGDETAPLIGATFAGDPIQGSDSILTVRCP
jgi:hypothetical protein